MKENREATDTNVGDIEEAIERLEYIDRTYSCNNYYSIWDLKCIEILLSDYKRVLKENEEVHKENEHLHREINRRIKLKIENEKIVDTQFISIQKIKDKIKEEIKYHEKNILDIENVTMLKSKTAKEEAEIEFNKYAIVVLKKMLQELIEEREEK